jgi:multidrug resistance efflux pump
MEDAQENQQVAGVGVGPLLELDPLPDPVSLEVLQAQIAAQERKKLELQLQTLKQANAAVNEGLEEKVS